MGAVSECSSCSSMPGQGRGADGGGDVVRVPASVAAAAMATPEVPTRCSSATGDAADCHACDQGRRGHCRRQAAWWNEASEARRRRRQGQRSAALRRGHGGSGCRCHASPRVGTVAATEAHRPRGVIVCRAHGTEPITWSHVWRDARRIVLQVGRGLQLCPANRLGHGDVRRRTRWSRGLGTGGVVEATFTCRCGSPGTAMAAIRRRWRALAPATPRTASGPPLWLFR
mmetsp:Transcript_108037/g.304367  ORF Transcript_108037/g.304367 Transcript_108037/m.304367 type:complete len:228 (+) Transcript_108037:128-811(+)